MAEATAPETSGPPSKRSRKSLSLKKKGNPKEKERFELADLAEIESAKQAIVPANTQKSTKWALGVLDEWLEQRNKRTVGSDDQCPPDLLMTDDGRLLCKWLCVFVTEVRKSDGSEYTPRSICQLLSGLQREINAKKKEPLKIVDNKSPVFKDLHSVLDRRYRNLHAQGIGTTKRKSEIITLVEEEQLWETNTLNDDTPLGLNSVRCLLLQWFKFRFTRR